MRGLADAIWLASLAVLGTGAARGQDAALAKQLSNPIAGVRYWADSPEGGPEGFGFRFAATLLFPR